MIHDNETSHRPRNALRAHQRPGVVLIMTILALVLLVGLIFYVYNVGQQINSRMTLQHAADSAAISGSTWMARSMNQVAMNNVGQAKMYSTVLVLDSLPLATEMSLHEATKWEERLTQQIHDGVPNERGAGKMIMDGLQSLQSRMDNERKILDAMNNELSTFPMETITFYALAGDNTPPPHGQLWKAAQAMDEFSRATVSSSGTLAQNNAIRWGMANGVNVQTAFLTPILPKVPVRRTTFADFQFPLEGFEKVDDTSGVLFNTGGAGGAISDMTYPYRLGPWARLHRWRNNVYSGGHRIPGDTQVRGGAGGHGPGGRSVGSSAVTQTNDSWVGGKVIGYTTYGPLEWELRAIGAWAGPHSHGMGELADTFFSSYMRTLSHDKLQYMFHSRNPIQIHRSEWHTDYAECHQLAADPTKKVFRTMFYVIEIASSVPPTDARWLTPGTFRANAPPPDDADHRPISMQVSGWSDPEKWGIPKIHNHIWRDESTYQTTNDPGLGIHAAKDAQGNDIWFDVYLTSFYVWGGIDIGGNVEVRNPCNWTDGQELSAPILLDTTGGDYNLNPDADFRREYFAYLGAAQAGQPPREWTSKFGPGSPSGVFAATAQAKVFNRSSFDLWTQNWETDLMPVTNMDQWLNQMGGGAAQAVITNGLLTPTQVTGVRDYFIKIDPKMLEQQTKH